MQNVSLTGVVDRPISVDAFADTLRWELVRKSVMHRPEEGTKKWLAEMEDWGESFVTKWRLWSYIANIQGTNESIYRDLMAAVKGDFDKPERVLCALYFVWSFGSRQSISQGGDEPKVDWDSLVSLLDDSPVNNADLKRFAVQYAVTTLANTMQDYVAATGKTPAFSNIPEDSFVKSARNAFNLCAVNWGDVLSYWVLIPKYLSAAVDEFLPDTKFTSPWMTPVSQMEILMIYLLTYVI